MIDIEPLNTGAFIDVLMRHVGIGERDASTFAGKMKHFQRLGFPKGNQTGSGRHARYSIDHLLQMVLALELYALGDMLPPRIAISIVNGSWPFIRQDVHGDLEIAMHGRPPHHLVWHVPASFENADGQEAIRGEPGHLVSMSKDEAAAVMESHRTCRRQCFLMRGAISHHIAEALDACGIRVLVPAL